MKYLLIPNSILLNIIRNVQRSYPYEVAGVLLGSEFRDFYKVRTVYHFKKCRITEYSFNFDIMEWMHVITNGRRSGLAYLGLYHSHPNAHAIPSNIDIHRMIECPGEIWLIIALPEANTIEYAAYTVLDPASALLKLNIIISEN